MTNISINLPKTKKSIQIINMPMQSMALVTLFGKTDGYKCKGKLIYRASMNDFVVLNVGMFSLSQFKVCEKQWLCRTIFDMDITVKSFTRIN